MSFVLNCQITIGKYIFMHVHFVRINQSRKTLVDTAVIHLPQNYNGEYLASKISAGEAVEIKLGYDGELKTEFTGYVSEILPRTPVEIRCEDQMYQLKRTETVSRSWPETTLRNVIQYLVPDASIVTPELTLTNVSLIKAKHPTIAKALQWYKENYGLDIYFRENGVLYAGLGYNDPAVIGTDPVVYDLQLNVIRPLLTYRKGDDVLIKVKAVSIMPDNEKIEAEAGDPSGELRTLHFYNVSSQAELITMAEEKLISLKYDGYQGSLLTFGQPRSVHGQVAKVQNDKYGARDGSYFIDAVTITFGVTGYRREVYLGKKAA